MKYIKDEITNNHTKVEKKAVANNRSILCYLCISHYPKKQSLQ